MAMGKSMLDHIPQPLTGVVMTQDQLQELKQSFSDAITTAVASLHTMTPNVQGAGSALTDAQFAELKRLLEPGFQLSSLYLAQHQGATPAPPQPAPDVIPAPPVPPDVPNHAAAEQQRLDAEKAAAESAAHQDTQESFADV